MVDPIRATEKDWENVLSGAREGGYMARCILELRDRVAALEAAAAHPAPAAESAVWVGTAADVAPQLVPITTADNLSPVEPAPQAQQKVTVEELAFILSEAPSGDLGAAYWLRKHPRLGPLLRGEGAPAPKRVVLPEEPPGLVSDPKWIFDHDFRYMHGRRDAWAAARAEVERQQGGQADG